jgi:adenine-specific DNA-methyltransferase
MVQDKLQKLELTWIGKDDKREPIEPRILIENPKYSHGVSESGNMLIHGDNLLALKALEQEYAGKVKCICIDPPYNTGSAFDHYDDGIEHSIWLMLMHERLTLLHKLLSDDGSIWIAIDDNECHYLKVMCDEIFGRNCFLSAIAWRSGDAPNNDSKQFSIDHNTILVYAKRSDWKSKSLPRTEESNAHYKNPDNDPKGPWFSGNVSSPNPRPNLIYDLTAPNGNIINPPNNGWRWKKEKMYELINKGEVVFSKDNLRIVKKTYLQDQKGLAPSSIWYDIEETGHNRQAKYELMKLFPGIPTSELFKTPKPEKLIKKILIISTNEGDLVLDSFLGSGTTAAVAHKMGRKWIGVELGEHAITHCYPRLKQVVDGTDQGGISKALDWKGGGGFKFYKLASSLLNKDRFGNFVINKEYNADMLAAAMAKQEGFTYLPDTSIYWKQGQSAEQDFIFTTTQFLTMESLDAIHDSMAEGESLLICCTAFQNPCSNRYSNITIKKIPQMLLGRCEFGKDDYSLNIINLPEMEEDAVDLDTEDEETIDDSLLATNKNSEQTLFD